VIIRNAALRGRQGTWDLHMDDGIFRSVVAGPDGAGRRDGGSDGEVVDAAGRLVVEPFVE
jgi:cytosine deaminase